MKMEQIFYVLLAKIPRTLSIKWGTSNPLFLISLKFEGNPLLCKPQQ